MSVINHFKRFNKNVTNDLHNFNHNIAEHVNDLKNNVSDRLGGDAKELDQLLHKATVASDKILHETNEKIIDLLEEHYCTPYTNPKQNQTCKKIFNGIGDLVDKGDDKLFSFLESGGQNVVAHLGTKYCQKPSNRSDTMCTCINSSIPVPSCFDTTCMSNSNAFQTKTMIDSTKDCVSQCPTILNNIINSNGNLSPGNIDISVCKEVDGYQQAYNILYPSDSSPTPSPESLPEEIVEKGKNLWQKDKIWILIVGGILLLVMLIIGGLTIRQLS